MPPTARRRPPRPAGWVACAAGVSGPSPEPTSWRGLATIPALRRILEVVAVDTLSLDNGIARSRVLIALVATAAKLIEVGELEDRIGRLESSLSERPLPSPVFPQGDPARSEVLS